MIRGRHRDIPSSFAVNTLSLTSPDDYVRECSTALENKHGICFAGLCLSLAHGAYIFVVRGFEHCLGLALQLCMELYLIAHIASCHHRSCH